MTEIAVFGASGRTGRCVVEVGLSRGLRVRAFVRASTPFEAPSGVTVLRGSLEDPSDVVTFAVGHLGDLVAVRVQFRYPGALLIGGGITLANPPDELVFLGSAGCFADSSVDVRLDAIRSLVQ